jgi:drug/metabolite transporter (DMT)-like permease
MCVVWGIPYFLIRIAVGEISPVMLVFARTAIGALILMPIVLAKGGLRGIGRKWIPLLVFAALEIGGPWFFLSSAEQNISSSLAALLISCVPLIGIVVSPLFGRQEGIGLGA